MQSSIVNGGLMLLASLLLTACGGTSESGQSQTNKPTPDSATPATPGNTAAVNLKQIQDPALQQCVADTGVQYTEQLQILECTDAGISDLSGLQQFHQLAVLNLTNNQIHDLEPLAHLQQLRSLSLAHNQLQHLDALTSLSNLHELGVAYNQLENLDGVQTLKKLQKLYTDNNHITSLEPLANTQLLHLVAHNNPAPLPDSLPNSLKSFRI